MFEFDEKDEILMKKKFEQWEKISGARVGDFIRMKDGSLQRFTHDWGDGLQTTGGDIRDAPHYASYGSFYFGGTYVSYSGGLDPMIPNTEIEKIEDEKIEGWFWFFHHNFSGAGRGVNFKLPCRLFKQI